MGHPVDKRINIFQRYFGHLQTLIFAHEIAKIKKPKK